MKKEPWPNRRGFLYLLPNKSPVMTMTAVTAFASGYPFQRSPLAAFFFCVIRVSGFLLCVSGGVLFFGEVRKGGILIVIK